MAIVAIIALIILGVIKAKHIFAVVLFFSAFLFLGEIEKFRQNYPAVFWLIFIPVFSYLFYQQTNKKEG